MKYTRPVFAALVLLVTLGLCIALAQQPLFPVGGKPGQPPPPGPMSFFVTSVGNGDGANYGGLAGADAHCQALAKAAGRGDVTWRAYLSTQGRDSVDARDRIGYGPWHNARGEIVALNLADLHGDVLDWARVGNRINKQTARDEKGQIIKGVGDTPNQHDILTGSRSDGRGFVGEMDHTCNNWTSNASGSGSAEVGHHDKTGGPNGSWNSAHGSRGCSQANLVETGGSGRLYCFAVRSLY